MGFFEKLVAGLGKTRDNIVSGMDSIFHGFSRIDDDFYEELEEVLIMGDLGVQATYDILDVPCRTCSGRGNQCDPGSSKGNRKDEPAPH